MLTSIAVILASVIATGNTAFNSSLCTNPPPMVGPPPPLPDLPPQFSAHIECVFTDQNRTIEANEFLDGPNNRGVIQQTSYGIDMTAYYNYSLGELLVVFPQSKVCVTADLSGYNQRALIGIQLSANSSRIYSAQAALHFGGSQTHLGKAVIRGIRCDVWYSCQYLKDRDTTANVMWYFADTAVWDQSLGIATPPVRCHVTGVVNDNTTGPRKIDHTYEFMHFRDSVSDNSVFETPHGVSCPGRKNAVPFPKLSTTASYSIQLKNENTKTTSTAREMYDSNFKLSRYDYRPSSPPGQLYNPNRLKVIHDFNTGVQYTIDAESGNCTVGTIDGGSWDVQNTDAIHVRMRTAREFFNLQGASMVYTGMRETRGVNCDTWIGNTTIYISSQLNYNAKLEFAFITPNSGVSITKYNGPQPMPPVPFEYRLDMDDGNVHFVYNIFDYDTSQLLPREFDVSACYAYLLRRGFEFQIPDVFVSNVQQDLDGFLYYTRSAIMTTTNVSAIRISNLMSDQRASGFFIMFEINDVAPVPGDVANKVHETSLTDAANNLIAAISGNTFVIGDLDLSLLIAPVPGTLREVTITVPKSDNPTLCATATDTTLFSSGAFAGVGVGMVLVGIMGGGGSFFIWYKRQP